MTFDAEAELSSLTSALLAHLEWAESLGTLGTPPLDEEWLQSRRAQYRALVVEAEVEHDAPATHDATATQPEAATTESTPGHAPPPTLRSTTDSPPVVHPPPELAEQPIRPAVEAAPVPVTPPFTAAPVPVTPPFTAAPVPGPPPFPATPVQAPPPAVLPRAAPAAPVIAFEPRSTADALARLQVLEQEVKACTRCRLHETRTQTVFARGNGSSGVCFVGEGPGADEDLQGLPFVGAAGQLLDRMITAMGLQRDDVYVCNIVKCRPPQNRKPMPDEAKACQSFLDEQLQLLAPRVIVALGATAAAEVLGVTLSITRLRGNWRLYRGKIPVMPTFHPSYLLRTPAAKREVWNDLLLVLDQVGLPRPNARK